MTQIQSMFDAQKEYESSDAHKRFLLAQVRSTQDGYWRALSMLERALGVELNSTDDYSNCTLESLTK